MALLRWDVPFADEAFPSVSVYVNGGYPTEMKVLVRSPLGQYRVEFGDVAAYRVEDESFAPVKRFNELQRDQEGLSAYLWIGSPWLMEYRESKEAWFPVLGELTHYVILGGDQVVEILGASPKVELEHSA